MTTKYLTPLVTARQVYRLIYSEALSYLPPDKQDESLTSRISCGEISRRLNRNLNDVILDLVRLSMHNWIHVAGSIVKTHRTLGTRAKLLADQAAFEATGVEKFVTKEVLESSPIPAFVPLIRERKPKLQPKPKPAAQDSRDWLIENGPKGGLGSMRKWRPGNDND